MVIDKHFTNFTSSGYAVRYAGFTGAFAQSDTLTQVRFRRYNHAALLNTTNIKIVVFDSALKVKSINSATFTGAAGNEIATSSVVSIPVSAGDGVLLWESGASSNSALSLAANTISDGFYSDNNYSFSVGNTFTIQSFAAQPGIELTVSGGGTSTPKPQASTGGL
ncbi:MAG: hypothetical protein VB133_09620 [Anaeromusa sp.]|uniref:hypothetical protein n=1 Tax=Anaeromusa sp. TaxID=1872520 RepID=UPI002B2206AA|nr:hypothetical protein [Anaeromusa sp.]MEA4835382.1 hypothetical protein [Anaeromusa sp.]